MQLVLKGYHEKTCPKPAGQGGWECQPGVPGLDKNSGKELGGWGTWRISQAWALREIHGCASGSSCSQQGPYPQHGGETSACSLPAGAVWGHRLTPDGHS